MEIVSKLVN